MKNIHLIPTDKPSRLFYNKKDSIFTIDNDFEYVIKEDWFQDYNIYITSDEKIKEGNYVCASGGFRFVKTLNKDRARTFKDDGIVSKQNPLSSCHLSNYKKIILTTDQDLIEDGVQAIEDEFLEWFVKNPSCEWVEVDLVSVNDFGSEITVNGYGFDKFIYKITIPKEEPTEEAKQRAKNYMSLKGALEPKQETLEVNGLNNLKKEFIPYEQALALKELGFDEPCIMQWTYAPELIFCTTTWGYPKLKTNKESYLDSGGDCISAPTFSQCFRWFREKYKIRFIIQSSMSDLGEFFKVIFPNGEQRGASYNTYEEAELAAILKLIEIVKNQNP